jgi:hypothetical protein
MFDGLNKIEKLTLLALDGNVEIYALNLLNDDRVDAYSTVAICQPVTFESFSILSIILATSAYKQLHTKLNVNKLRLTPLMLHLGILLNNLITSSISYVYKKFSHNLFIFSFFDK